MSEPIEDAETPLEEPAEPQEPSEEPEAVPADEPGEEEEHEETEAQALSFDQMSEGEQSKVLDKLDREAERHTKRLTEILQEDALMLLPCELCNPRHAGWVDLKNLTPETKQRVRIMIGDREPRKLQHDRYSRRCEACDGETVVETGSKDQFQAELPCYDCEGKGWVNVGPERLGPKVASFTPTVVANGPEATEQPVPLAPTMSPEEQAAFDLLRSKNFAVIAPVR